MPPQLILARATIQYKGPRARGIQNIPPDQRDESLEWGRTLQDLEKVQLKNATFIPVEYEVVWQSGLMVVSWLFAKDSELLQEFRLLMRTALRRVTVIAKESNIQSMRYSEVPHVDSGPKAQNASPSRIQAKPTPSPSMRDKPPSLLGPAPKPPPPPLGPPPNHPPPPVNPPQNQPFALQKSTPFPSNTLHRPPPSSTLPPKPISNLPPKPANFPHLPTSDKPMPARKASQPTLNRPPPPRRNSHQSPPTAMDKPTPPVSSNKNQGEPTQFPTPVVNTKVSTSFSQDPRTPPVTPTLPNSAGPKSSSQPIKVGMKRKYSESNETPDRGGERKAPEPPKSRAESSRSAPSSSSEATRDKQLLVQVRRVAGELKKKETILSAAIEVEKKANVSLQSELSQVRMRFSELERSYNEERINRTNAEAKLNEETRHRLRVEKTLEKERSENDEYKKKISALNLELAKQRSDMIAEGSTKDAERLKQLHEVCKQRKAESDRANTLSESLEKLKQDKELVEKRLREEVSKKKQAEEKLEQSRLEAESSAFVLPALTEAFQKILGLSQQARVDLGD